MSIGTFFKSLEDAAVKVTSFIVKEMTAAESLLGANTGNAKANLVIKTVEAALGVAGIDVTGAAGEVKAVIDALVALFNKTGLFTTTGSGSNVPAPPQPTGL